MKIKICGLFREQDIDYVNEGRPDFAGFVFAGSKRQVTFDLAQRLRSRLADGIAPVGVFVNAQIDEITSLYRGGIISIVQLHGSEDEGYILKLKEKNSNLPVIKVCKFLTIRRKKDSKENRLVRQPGWLSHKSCGFSSDHLISGQTTKLRFYKEVVQKHRTFGTQFPNNSNDETGQNFAYSAYSGILNNKDSDYILIDSGAGSGKTFDWNFLKNLKIEKPWFLAGGINIDNIESAMALNPFAVDVSSGAETDGIKSREKIIQLIAAVRKGKK